jgi:hypothetical protein
MGVCALTVAHVFCAGSARRVRFEPNAGEGTLSKCAPLRLFGGHSADGALVLPDAGASFDPEHPLVGALSGHLSGFFPGLSVLLQGQAGVVTGRIIIRSWTGRVRYPWGVRLLRSQFLVAVDGATIPLPGDSGGLWVTRSSVAVGLQVAVIGKFAVLTPLDRLLAGWQGRLIRTG